MYIATGEICGAVKVDITFFFCFSNISFHLFDLNSNQVLKMTFIVLLSKVYSGELEMVSFYVCNFFTNSIGTLKS